MEKVEPEKGGLKVEPEKGEPKKKPKIEEPKEVDWVIKIPAKVRSSSSIQKMANDLIERVKVEMAR